MQYAVELMNSGYVLRGMVHRPCGDGPFPTVILYHGFTGTKLEPHGIFRKMSLALEAIGIVSIRFDFGGHGESDGDFEAMTLSREVQEAHAIRDYAAQLPYVDEKRLGLLGLSLGGAVASIVAGDLLQQVRALSLWAPAGMLKEVFDNILQQADPYGEDGRLDIWGNLLGPQAKLEVPNWDIYERARPYRGPVLLIHGESDATVPPEASQRYRQIYGKNADLVIIPEGDHTFNKVKWEAEVLRRTATFFRDKL